VPRLALPLALAIALLGAAPAAVAARERPHPLVDAAPNGTAFRDGVVTGARAAFRMRATTFKPYSIRDGGSVDVGFSGAYTPDDTVARSYVDFLDSLPHGSELRELAVYIAPPSEVLSSCGGIEGTLACYDGQEHVMIVPGEQQPPQEGVTTAYVVTHEYGHHVAAFRSNTPLPAQSFGPKRWSSRERVCDRAARGVLAPGNETSRYLENPGEGWAETYARLKYPQQPWTFAPVLKPDAAALQAARNDVQHPWTRSRHLTFRARFTPKGSSVRTFRFGLTLDGALSFHLDRPQGSRMVFSVSSLGVTRVRDHATKADFALACRQVRIERVTIRLRRTAGSGTATLRVTYAG
jgi:hypothetical protein